MSNSPTLEWLPKTGKRRQGIRNCHFRLDRIIWRRLEFRTFGVVKKKLRTTFCWKYTCSPHYWTNAYDTIAIVMACIVSSKNLSNTSHVFLELQPLRWTRKFLMIRFRLANCCLYFKRHLWFIFHKEMKHLRFVVYFMTEALLLLMFLMWGQNIGAMRCSFFVICVGAWTDIKLILRFHIYAHNHCASHY